MKKTWIIAGVIIACGVIGSSVYIFRNKIFKQHVQVTPQVVQEEKIALVTWNDPAGFSFQYPKNITINKHDEDTENYAHLELTNTEHPGRISIWAKDTAYTDVASWTAKDVTVKGGSTIDTTLGGKPAKKIILAQSALGGKKLITGAIDEQILFTIEAEPSGEDAYWQQTYDAISQSFVFVPASGNGEAAAPVQDTSPVVDEEEVLE